MKNLALGEYSLEYISKKKYTHTRKKSKEYTIIELNIFLIFLFFDPRKSPGQSTTPSLFSQVATLSLKVLLILLIQSMVQQ